MESDKLLEMAHEFSHGDFRRMLVVRSASSTHFDELFPEESKEASTLFKRALLTLHVLRFGCVPVDCQRCKDVELCANDLNCDDMGNPKLGGTFLHHKPTSYEEAH